MNTPKLKVEEKPAFINTKEPRDKGFLIKKISSNKKTNLSSGSFLFENKNSKSSQIEIISDIEQCFQLWKEFSPKKSIFDTWEFRFAFYKVYKYKPYFMLLRNHSDNLAVLPLWYDKKEKKYVWFGSDWNEETNFFTKNKDVKHIKTLLSAAPAPIFLNAIPKASVKMLKGTLDFEKDDPKYTLSLKKIKTHEDYLMTVKKNTRRSLRKDKRRIEKQNPKIIFDNFSDLDVLVKLSKKRCSDKGEKASWEEQRDIDTFKEIIKFSGKSYIARMITVKIGKKPAGVDLICLHNKTYYALICGYDVKRFPGIGNFFNMLEIDDAINLGMKKIDFLQNSYNWKNRYFKETKLFKYEKSASV